MAGRASSPEGMLSTQPTQLTPPAAMHEQGTLTERYAVNGGPCGPGTGASLDLVLTLAWVG